METRTGMKYVILAQPKSASTSLLKTLGELIGESYGQQVVSSANGATASHLGPIGKVANRIVGLAGLKLSPASKFTQSPSRLRDDCPAIGYPLMSTIHVDVCDFNEGTIPFHLRYALHKQHFPPTRGNVTAFRKTPKIVLIRDVDNTLDAYLRMTSLPGYFRYMIEHDPEFRQALKDELLAWQSGWKAEVEQHGGLVLDFEDITKRTPESMRRALREFGIKKPEAELQSVELARERYSRA